MVGNSTTAGGIIRPAPNAASATRRNRAERRVSQKLTAEPSGMISSTEATTVTAELTSPIWTIWSGRDRASARFWVVGGAGGAAGFRRIWSWDLKALTIVR